MYQFSIVLFETYIGLIIKLLSNGQKSLLISDGVGVGKTISAGYIIQYVNIILQKPVIILCPPVLEQKWIMDKGQD